MTWDTVFFGLLTRSVFDGLLEYYETNESLLASIEKEDSIRINKEVNIEVMDSALSKEREYAEWDMRMQEHDAKYHMLFTNFFRYSYIVLISSVLEDHLYKLCRALQDIKQYIDVQQYLKARKNDRTSTIEKYKNYINDVGVSVRPNLWEVIKDLNAIRNCIVHSSGNVNRSRYQDLMKIAEKGVGIRISGKSDSNELTPLYLADHMLMIEAKYCKSIIPQITVLFEELCKAAQLPTTIRFENNSIVFK